MMNRLQNLLSIPTCAATAGCHDRRQRGRAVQVEPMKPMLKGSGNKRLKLNYEQLLSNFAFNFNLRRYNAGTQIRAAAAGAVEAVVAAMVGRCRALIDPLLTPD